MVDNTSIRFEVFFLLSFIELLIFFDEYNEVSLYSVLAEVKNNSTQYVHETYYDHFGSAPE